MKKKLIGVLVIVCSVIMYSIVSHPLKNQRSTEEVLESAWDEFGLFSFGIGETDPVISIGMDKTKSEEELRRYLNDNLSDEDKEKYEVKIIKEDINVLERQHEKYLESNKAH
ncbi:MULTISPECIES: hypothetical protein [Bacillus]|uniref:Bacteriophage protein n=1 Tax=Bacillus amyloliquefaciens (strain ATCC 23350 / DSM 7 / BCRC 11601 / CCUG 28519 / NBRC 15535 / NRRL B-14393 / F) TaxID=692420 RepID=A0A9P1NHH3_BACAS|nr:hypothetical protein [Bacillus amyloliquefaciens]AIW33232.1 hypothetical protein KS08_06115 [Bacillus subtilis]AEB24406.1 bacteriophage protein [Bacillus amyloliquefaciens TA208]ARW38473.1 Prophage-derived-like uncharacterized protein YozM [Bacillus amyloliquefaciens]AZV88730.1 hypothetical protein BUN12_0466 [Bacillus amyloliquefaciens]MBW8279476.1 hypothetical protein [Bacillus amyloliquefaciens]